MAADHDGRTYQGGQGVDVGSQHGGYFLHKNIANHSPANPRQRTEQNCGDRASVKGQRLLRTCDGKEGQPGSVEQQDGAAQTVDERIPEERDDACEHGDGEIRPVADRRGRNGSDHDVPRNAARVPRREAQHQDAEEIKPVLDGFGRTTEREHERSGQVEYSQQRGQRMFKSRGDHADIHACAATTTASTPASKVGWMTGAKRGL